MWFALFLVVFLTVWWIAGPFWLALAALIVWHDAGWALGAVVALAYIASLAGWFDRFRECSLSA